MSAGAARAQDGVQSFRCLAWRLADFQGWADIDPTHSVKSQRYLRYYAYVVHFSRLPAAGNVEDLLTAAYPNIRTAYAHVPPAGGRAVKHLTDTDIIRSG